MSPDLLLREAEQIVEAVAASFHIPGYPREDLEQEIRLAILAKADRYDPERSEPRVWARMVAVHRMIDLKRSVCRRPRLNAEPPGRSVEDRGCRPGFRILDVRARLTPLQLATVEKLESGRTQAEIARERGVSRQAVHRMVGRIRAKVVPCAQ